VICLIKTYPDGETSRKVYQEEEIRTGYTEDSLHGEALRIIEANTVCIVGFTESNGVQWVFAQL
jgi:hypothetical protein